MVLTSTTPNVAAFPELHTFRCPACGDVRTVEKELADRFSLQVSGGTDAMTDEKSRVDRLANGTFSAFWRGQIVYDKGRVKHFETEREAWDYLATCDEAGKVVY